MRADARQPRCVFLGVRGLLWPERWPDQARAFAAQDAQLRAIFPSWPARRVRELRAHLETRAEELSLAWTQDTAALIAQAATDLGLVLDLGLVDAVRVAMCLPAREHLTLLPGAEELLGGLVELELPVGVVVNSSWRGREDFRRDFEALGIGDQIGTIVTSLDTGLRKPHPGIFARAVELAGCLPEHALIVGHSERNDIEPARALGLRTIRLATDGATASAADHVAVSLHAVIHLISDLARQRCA